MTSVRTLLLLFLSSLLVTMGKAKCLFPVLNGNHVLSLESRLKNEFPDGSTAVAECARGYEAKDGSPLITCQNGKWSKVELKCEKMDCGPPEPQSSHMTYLINNGTLFGAYVKALCDTGYDLEGSSYRQCLVTGWNGRATCTSIECGVPTIKFGNQTEGNPPYLHKSQATFECLPGYRMNGSATSVCEERGWSALPECVKAILLQPEETTTVVASTVTTDIATTNAVFCKEEEEEEEEEEEHFITVSQNNSVWIIVVAVLATLAIVCILCGLLHYNYKHKGSYNTGEDQRTKDGLLLYQTL